MASNADIVRDLARELQMEPAPILIVDDDDGVRQLLKAICNSEEMPCVLAADGAEAMAIYDRAGESSPKLYPFALVFLDLWMPTIGGIDVLRHIKSLSPDQPVMVLSAHIEKEVIAEAAQMGNVTFANKPFPVQQAIQTLRVHREAWQRVPKAGSKLKFCESRRRMFPSFVFPLQVV